jgi:hypothetical protein
MKAGGVHDLRHGAATLALAGGVDLKTVSEMLGHSTFTTPRTRTPACCLKLPAVPLKRLRDWSRAAGNSQNRSFPPISGPSGSENDSRSPPAKTKGQVRGPPWDSNPQPTD